jgi:DNA polymerase III epsilon subunit-like protein
VAAHCAQFDLAFLGWTGEPALCTMRLARAVFPEAPNHKNQTLREYLRIDGVIGEREGAHRALDDAIVTAHILIACRRRFLESSSPKSWGWFKRANAMVTLRGGRAA